MALVPSIEREWGERVLRVCGLRGSLERLLREGVEMIVLRGWVERKC